MRIWLDDTRPMPADYDTHVKTAEECIELLKNNQVEAISLDYDLGIGYVTGLAVAEYIRDHLVLPIERMRVHTMSDEMFFKMGECLRQARERWKSV